MGKGTITNQGIKGVVKPSDIMLGICPHCGRKLSKLKLFQRKRKKTCKCRNCGKKIDERYVIY